MANKYQRGKIYKITADETDQVYIGSTTEPTLARRMAGHRGHHGHWKKGGGHYVTSFEIIQHPSAIITLVETYPCNSKDELTSRERYHIENTPNVVNKLRLLNPTYEEGKQQKREYHHKHSKEINVIKSSIVYCECGTQSTHVHLSRHKKSDRHRLLMEKQNQVIIPKLTIDDMNNINAFIKSL